MRKKGIKKLTSFYLQITKRRNDLFILVHLTKIVKRINQLKKASRYIKLWKLYLKLLKEREAQLKKLEKSFSQTYEKLSDDIFLDVGDETSVQTQMKSFVDKVNFGNGDRKNEGVFKTLNSLDIFFPERFSQDILFNYYNFKTDNNGQSSKNSRNKIKSSIFEDK